MGEVPRFSEGGIVGRWADKTRLTVDIPTGSYAYLSSMVDEVNARTPDGERRMTLSRLVRGPIGTLIANERRQATRGGQGVRCVVRPVGTLVPSEESTRLTCDISRGSYAQLWRIVHARNAAVGTMTPRVRIADIVRAQVGSMMQTHRRAQLPRTRRVRA